MNNMLTIAYRCNLAGTVLLGLMALVYLGRRKFMPYHAVALGRTWVELDRPTQTLFLASMRIIGSAWLAVTVAMSILLRYAFHGDLRWAVCGVPAIGLVVAVPTLLAVLRVKVNTKASPPVPALVLVTLLFLAGLVCGLLA